MRFSPPDPLSNLKRHLREIRRGGYLEVHERVDMRAWTALKIGGVAELVVCCHCVDALKETLDLLATHGCSWVLLGTGSLLVPADDGLGIPVLSLGGELTKWQLEEDSLLVGAGANMTQLARSLARSGAESLLGRFEVSGSAAGQLVRERRLGLQHMSSLLQWVELVRPGASPERIHPRSPEERAELVIPSRAVVAQFALAIPGSPNPVTTRLSREIPRGGRFLMRPRQATGIFRSPPSVSAEELLRAAGCAAMRVGGASVGSPALNSINVSRHCSAEHVLALVRRMRDAVERDSGQRLETRLRFLDREGRRIVP